MHVGPGISPVQGDGAASAGRHQREVVVQPRPSLALDRPRERLSGREGKRAKIIALLPVDPLCRCYSLHILFISSGSIFWFLIIMMIYINIYLTISYIVVEHAFQT